MAKVGEVLKGAGGLGLSVLGLFGGQPEVTAAGVGLTGSVLSNKVTTQVQATAAAAQRGINAYNAAASQLAPQRSVSFMFPSWLLWLGGGLLIYSILRRRR